MGLAKPATYQSDTLVHINAGTSEIDLTTAFSMLLSLPGPCVIHIPGKHRGCRIVTTLLHGNEPSGLEAVHRLLTEKFVPYVDTKIIIVSVHAAREEPVFSHRSFPNGKDLNRCFRPPYQGVEGKLAKQIIDYVVSEQPEAVIDLHNTSGSGPAFTVSARQCPEHIALASHFSRWFIHTKIQLGSLMEVPLPCPIITVEAGGALDEDASRHAYTGLHSFLRHKDIYQQQQEVERLLEPKRLEIHQNTSLAYADRPVFGANITLCQDIEQHNFGVTPPGTVLGWVDHDKLEHFRIGGGNAPINRYFDAKSNELVVVRPMRFFMITSRVDIAKSDCLLYFVDMSPTPTKVSADIVTGPLAT